MWALLLLTYLGILVFAVFVARKAARYASAPMHLRWELYPIPHEVGKEYGGSFMEEPDWWAKPRHNSLVGELRGMLPEMLFMVALWHHNRKLWYLSYPFHGGIYLVVGFIALLVIGAIAQAAGAPVANSADPLWAALQGLTVVVGAIGMLSVTVGSLGLLLNRLGNEEIRRYSVPADYFNLVFILVIALSGLYAWLTADPSFVQLRAFVQGALTFSPPAALPAPTVAQLTLFALLLLYMPFTHMTHFVGKWFTYHTVRWDDATNDKGAYDRYLATLLNRPVGWSGPHIATGKTWVQVATQEVEK